MTMIRVYLGSRTIQHSSSSRMSKDIQSSRATHITGVSKSSSQQMLQVRLFIIVYSCFCLMFFLCSNSSITAVPSAPVDVSPPAELAPYIARLKQLFDSRPIWSNLALRSRLPLGDSKKFKRCLILFLFICFFLVIFIVVVVINTSYSYSHPQDITLCSVLLAHGSLASDILPLRLRSTHRS